MRLVATALLAFALATPASAVVNDSSPSGFTLENSEDVPTSPADTWKALVEDVGRWWPADHTWWGDASRLSIEPRAGGCFCEIHGDQQARHMGVTFVDPGRTLQLGGLAKHLRGAHATATAE